MAVKAVCRLLGNGFWEIAQCTLAQKIALKHKPVILCIDSEVSEQEKRARWSVEQPLKKILSLTIPLTARLDTIGALKSA
jgi:hypothetical protein